MVTGHAKATDAVAGDAKWSCFLLLSAAVALAGGGEGTPMSGGAEVSVERSVEYWGGKLLDIYRAEVTDMPGLTVLLWHGVGPDERDALEPLAREVAGSRRLTVVAPD